MILGSSGAYRVGSQVLSLDENEQLNCSKLLYFIVFLIQSISKLEDKLTRYPNSISDVSRKLRSYQPITFGNFLTS